MIAAHHFSVIHDNGIFAGTFTAEAIGDEPYCEFSNPDASALKPFSNPHSYCVLSDAIHWVTGTAPLDEDSNFSCFFFYWKLVLFGHNNAQHDILGIHDYSFVIFIHKLSDL